MRSANDNRTVIIVEELPDGREVAVRAPLAEREPMRMTGPDRGDFEERRLLGRILACDGIDSLVARAELASLKRRRAA